MGKGMTFVAKGNSQSAQDIVQAQIDCQRRTCPSLQLHRDSNTHLLHEKEVVLCVGEAF